MNLSENKALMYLLDEREIDVKDVRMLDDTEKEALKGKSMMAKTAPVAYYPAGSMIFVLSEAVLANWNHFFGLEYLVNKPETASVEDYFAAVLDTDFDDTDRVQQLVDLIDNARK